MDWVLQDRIHSRGLLNRVMEQLSLEGG